MNDIPKRYIEAVSLAIPRSADAWTSNSELALESQGASPARSIGQRIYNFTTALSQLIRTWTQRVEERRHLATLDDHMLRDIGLAHHDILKETSKSFWQP